MRKVKFIVKPLKVTRHQVFMTMDQIKANSSLFIKYPNTSHRDLYMLKDGRIVIPAVDYDDKLFITTKQLQDYLWQSIRGCEMSCSSSSLQRELARQTAKAFSLHNAVLRQNHPHYDESLSEILAMEEGLTTLTNIIKDKDYYQELLDSCNKADQQSVNPEWLDVFGERITKKLLCTLLYKGAFFMSGEAMLADSASRRRSLSYNAISCYLYASRLEFEDYSTSINLIVYDTHFHEKDIMTVVEDMKI